MARRKWRLLPIRPGTAVMEDRGRSAFQQINGRQAPARSVWPSLLPCVPRPASTGARRFDPSRPGSFERGASRPDSRRGDPLRTRARDSDPAWSSCDWPSHLQPLPFVILIERFDESMLSASDRDVPEARLLRLDQPVADRVAGELHAVAHLQLLEDVRAVSLDRLLADYQ
jgi:hypothetical protein